MPTGLGGTVDADEAKANMSARSATLAFEPVSVSMAAAVPVPPWRAAAPGVGLWKAW